jgi:prepilin-type N-terminal cleavage/methylation domain-containing protein
MMTYPNNRQGFTLVETMVAVTILAFALIGPFTAIQSALVSSYVARDRLTAASLAQEGLEYVRSVRDNNYLAGREWNDGFDSSQNSRNQCYGNGSTPSGYCVVDPTLGDFHTDADAMRGYSSAQVGSIPALRTNNEHVFIQEGSGGEEARFTRTIQIEELSDTEIRVTVVVSWNMAAVTYNATVVDNLHDWL